MRLGDVIIRLRDRAYYRLPEGVPHDWRMHILMRNLDASERAIPLSVDHTVASEVLR